jgi:hypothetical protein
MREVEQSEMKDEIRETIYLGICLFLRLWRSLAGTTLLNAPVISRESSNAIPLSVCQAAWTCSSSISNAALVDLLG